MGKIAKRPLSPLYCAAETTVEGLKDSNACSVIALSIIAGVSVEEAQAALRANGREDNKGAFDEVITKALADLGLTPRKWAFSDRRALIDTYPGVHKGLKSMTPNHAVRFGKAWKAAGFQNALLFTEGHVMAMRDGVVHDFEAHTMKRIVAVWSFDDMAPSAPESVQEAPEEAPAVDPAEGMDMGTETVTESPVEVAVEPTPFEGAADLPSPPCGEAVEAEEARLDGMTRNILRTECKKVGVKNYANIGKADMINAILRVRFPG